MHTPIYVIPHNSYSYSQGCQEDFWGPGQDFEKRPYMGVTFCEFILHGF